MKNLIYAVPALLALATAIAAETPLQTARPNPRVAAALAIAFSLQAPPVSVAPDQDKHDPAGDPFAPANKVKAGQPCGCPYCTCNSDHNCGSPLCPKLNRATTPPGCDCGDCAGGSACPGNCDRATCVNAKKAAKGKSLRADGKGFCSDYCTCGCNDGLPCSCGAAANIPVPALNGACSGRS